MATVLYVLIIDSLDEALPADCPRVLVLHELAPGV